VSSRSLPALLAGRVLTGLAHGAAVATATAYLADPDAGPEGAPSRRAEIVTLVANLGGLAIGPLAASLAAQYLPDKLTIPYLIFFGVAPSLYEPTGIP
jgi:MFS family permease